jgi:hypothetical protein
MLSEVHANILDLSKSLKPSLKVNPFVFTGDITHVDDTTLLLKFEADSLINCTTVIGIKVLDTIHTELILHHYTY